MLVKRATADYHHFRIQIWHKWMCMEQVQSSIQKVISKAELLLLGE